MGIVRTRFTSRDELLAFKNTKRTGSSRKVEQLPAEKNFSEYASRNALLRDYGYASYDAYLKSALWRRIKKEFLKGRLCLLCRRSASVLHHRSYDKQTMLYGDKKTLVPMCLRCHKVIEFDDKNRKATLKEANQKLSRLLVMKRADRMAAIIAAEMRMFR